MEPALILPDVKDPKQWRGAGSRVRRSGKAFLVMTPSQRGTLFVNPKVVKPQEIKSYKDLLNPKWQQKDRDGRSDQSGAGSGNVYVLLPASELGPNFIRALAKQEPTVLRDYTQEIDGIAREKYSDIDRRFRYRRRGTHEGRFAHRDPGSAADQGRLRRQPGSGGLGFFNRAPHQNAAKVYINWLLSKEGQEGLCQGQWLHQRALGRAHRSFAVESADTGIDQDLYATRRSISKTTLRHYSKKLTVDEARNDRESVECFL